MPRPARPALQRASCGLCLVLLGLGLQGCARGQAVGAAPAPFPVRDTGVARQPGHLTRSVRGWTLFVDERLEGAQRALGEEVLRLIDAQLAEVQRVVPAPALAALTRVPIWVEANDPHWACSEYHPSADWLREHGQNPAMARGIEIANAATFLRWSRDQPAIMLHELAHAYHDRVLGFDRADIAALHARAVAGGTYDVVLRRSGVRERAYALSTPQEYFAEGSEALFLTNDYFPFVRADLARHDPELYRLLRELWGVERDPR